MSVLVLPLQVQTDIQVQVYFFLLLCILAVILFFLLNRVTKKTNDFQNNQETLKANLSYVKQLYSTQLPLVKSISDKILQADFHGNINGIFQQGKTNYLDTTSDSANLYSYFPGKIHKKLQKTLTNLKDDRSAKESLYFSETNSEQKELIECRLIKTERDKILCTFRKKPELLVKLVDLTRKRQHLREKINSKDQFLSILAHDLRGPFNSLLGFSSILNNEYEDYSAEEKKQYINDIYKSSEQLFQILKNLLDWTRLHNGKIEFSPYNQDLINTIKTAYWEMEQYANEKDITLLINTPEELIIRHDSTMLHSAIVNLFSNAIKYSHPGTKVHMNVNQTSPEIIQINITDQGVGIDPEALTELFTIDGTYKKQGTQNESGSGLGLILCREFIGYHKGGIYVDSYPGKGSTFTIEIPVNQP
ncbi:MAG: HAMP domain-containing histidine kinase [Bacteroidales bacterium]|nr:HAMP domain-containing histidine kinase [Bacteroidales bacterium]MCF8327457.1 HAMP domain-containing histidine kinase [Bacteroidales bacterium]